MHWRERSRKAAKYKELLTIRQMAKLYPRIPKHPWEEAFVISIDVTIYNKMDEDNLKMRFKWFFDWLQREGYIGNDRNVHFLCQPVQTSKRYTKKHPNVLTDVFTITLKRIKP